MDYKGLILLSALAVAGIIISTFLIMGGVQSDSAQYAESGGADNIELLYFHRTDRCTSCNNAEQYARDTLNTYYPEEAGSGKISMQSIDYQQNKEMADKYDVNMQGLKIKTTRNGQETVRDVPEVWAYVKDRDAYMNYLKGEIDRELGK